MVCVPGYRSGAKKAVGRRGGRRKRGGERVRWWWRISGGSGSDRDGNACASEHGGGAATEGGTDEREAVELRLPCEIDLPDHDRITILSRGRPIRERSGLVPLLINQSCPHKHMSTHRIARLFKGRARPSLFLVLFSRCLPPLTPTATTFLPPTSPSPRVTRSRQSVRPFSFLLPRSSHLPRCLDRWRRWPPIQDYRPFSPSSISPSLTPSSDRLQKGHRHRSTPHLGLRWFLHQSGTRQRL